MIRYYLMKRIDLFGYVWLRLAFGEKSKDIYELCGYKEVNHE